MSPARSAARAREPRPSDRTPPPAPRWEARAVPEAAADRVLDAAGRCFARRGIGATTIGDIATEAGCSRPTIYRYFEGRDSVRVAFVRREAQRLGARIRAGLDTSGDPASWLADAVMAVLGAVRRDPTLSAWFTPDEVGTTVALALSPRLIEDLAGVLVDPDGGGPGALAREDAAWSVRVILSLLVSPGPDEATERRLVERYLVPVVSRRAPRSDGG